MSIFDEMLADDKPTASPSAGVIPKKRTSLSPKDESEFQDFYGKWSKKAGIDPDPDNPQHKYDYRGAFASGAVPKISDADGLFHWPSEFKDDDHPNRFVDGEDTKTGRRIESQPQSDNSSIFDSMIKDRLSSGEEDLTPVADWVRENPHSASTIINFDEPAEGVLDKMTTRSAFKKAGLPKMNATERQGYALKIQEAMKLDPSLFELDVSKPPDKPFFRAGDAAEGIWDAVKGLGTTAPAAFYQLKEGLKRPDKYSDKAKSAFKKADFRSIAMQLKTEANRAEGTSSSVGEAFRSAGDSLGFSLGSMSAAIPASIAGAKAGAITGASIAAVAGQAGPQIAAPEELVTVPVGAVVGGVVGSVTASMAASGSAAYRMAGASFLNESFQHLEAESMRKSGRPMNEEEKQSAYEALLPIARNTALWEAGPEAVGNAVTLGAGKIIFGLGKGLAGSFGKKALVKTIAGVGSLATELGTETITQVEQRSDQLKAEAIARGEDPDAINADWSAEGVTQAFKEVAPQTLALMGMIGGAGSVVGGVNTFNRRGDVLSDGNAVITTSSEQEVQRKSTGLKAATEPVAKVVEKPVVEKVVPAEKSTGLKQVVEPVVEKKIEPAVVEKKIEEKPAVVEKIEKPTKKEIKKVSAAAKERYQAETGHTPVIDWIVNNYGGILAKGRAKESSKKGGEYDNQPSINELGEFGKLMFSKTGATPDVIQSDAKGVHGELSPLKPGQELWDTIRNEVAAYRSAKVKGFDQDKLQDQQAEDFSEFLDDSVAELKKDDKFFEKGQFVTSPKSKDLVIVDTVFPKMNDKNPVIKYKVEDTLSGKVFEIEPSELTKDTTAKDDAFDFGDVEPKPKKKTVDELAKSLGVKQPAPQGELFGKGAVGDKFKLKTEKTVDHIEKSKKQDAIDKSKAEADKAQKKLGLKDDTKISSLKDRAKELGIALDDRKTSVADLEKQLVRAEQGGFIDIGRPKTTGKKEHTFINQQRENDAKVHEWKKKQAKSAIQKLRAELIDRQGDVKIALEKAGADDAVMRLVLRQGASAEASRQFIDSEASINKVLPRKLRTKFKDYIAALRVVEATKVQADKGIELKSPVEAKDAKDWLNNEFTKLPVSEQDAIKASAEKYWGVMQAQLDALRDEGMISDAAHKSIKENHRFYSPRRFVEFVDPVTQVAGGQNTHDSGVKALGKGSESALIQDPMYLMAHVISRTQSRIFKNKANKELLTVATQEGHDDLARVLSKNETPKRDEGVVKVFVDGQEQHIAMPAKLAEEWNGLPPALSSDMAKFLQWSSGTKIVKMLATGINPEFALSNLPRDAAYAWFSSGQYSPVLPIGALQLGADYAAVIKDAITRGPQYEQYIKDGGGMDFLTTQGITRSPIEGGHNLARKIGDILAWAGETSEVATRLAVRHRAMKNGMSSERATFVARNMLDFAQGGTFAKAADNVIPYLNAAFQGTRGGFRTFKNNPAEATFKAAQIAAIGYGLAQMIAGFFPELWNAISDREKATKWIIPLPWKEKDKDGNDRQAYIAVAKDQFQQIFAAIGQSVSDLKEGNQWGGQLTNAIESITPADMTTLPPIATAMFAYIGNFDTWARGKVWRGYDNITASLEVTGRTPKLAVDIANMASKIGIEISPERSAAATSKLLPKSNPLIGLLSTAYEMGDDGEEIGKTAVEKVKATPGVRRLLRFSEPLNVTPKTAISAKRLEIDTTDMTDRQARSAVKEKSRGIADVRQPLNNKLDRWLLVKTRTNSELRSWLRDNIEDSVERKRLWSRARSAKPESIKGPYKTSKSKKSRGLRF
jgi:hypothetical protein